MGGKVYLVGAGPGDPELLTLRALKALRRADVILCDDLVSEEVLAFVPPSARIVHVGKRGGCRSTPQEFIERLMVAEARRGRVVVRLKGGDPMIFGRGGEECAALQAAGIEHEVVNGITSGLAAATAAGIPWTHRDFCHGVIVITAHEAGRGETDWPALVRSGLPLVVYMGVSRAAALRSALLQAGAARGLPAAAISKASRRDQRAVRSTLERMVEDMDAAGIESPAILVIGEVAAFGAAYSRVQPPRPLEVSAHSSKRSPQVVQAKR